VALTGLIGLGLASCGGYFGDHPEGTGPFDSQGNYVEAWADDPSKWNGRAVPKPTEPEPEPQIAQAEPQSKPQVRPNPQPVKPAPPPKPKPKPKPKVTYHTVSRGDTLYGLSRKYGTSVSSIQRANGISGSLIRIGQRLKIPR